VDGGWEKNSGETHVTQYFEKKSKKEGAVGHGYLEVERVLLTLPKRRGE